jgi:hypothetical protein
MVFMISDGELRKVVYLYSENVGISRETSKKFRTGLALADSPYAVVLLS